MARKEDNQKQKSILNSFIKDATKVATNVAKSPEVKKAAKDFIQSYKDVIKTFEI